MNIVLYLLAALLIGLNIADWRTTRASMLSGKGREANPLMAFMIARFGLDAALIGKAIITGAFAIFLAMGGAPSQVEALILLLGLNALYLWAIRNNLRVLNP